MGLVVKWTQALKEIHCFAQIPVHANMYVFTIGNWDRLLLWCSAVVWRLEWLRSYLLQLRLVRRFDNWAVGCTALRTCEYVIAIQSWVVHVTDSWNTIHKIGAQLEQFEYAAMLFMCSSLQGKPGVSIFSALHTCSYEIIFNAWKIANHEKN